MERRRKLRTHDTAKYNPSWESSVSRLPFILFGHKLLESRELAGSNAYKVTDKLSIPYSSSFDKANRSSVCYSAGQA